MMRAWKNGYIVLMNYRKLWLLGTSRFYQPIMQKLKSMSTLEYAISLHTDISLMMYGQMYL